MKDSIQKHGGHANVHPSKSFFQSKIQESQVGNPSESADHFFQSASAPEIQKEGVTDPTSSLDQQRPMLSFGAQGPQVAFMQQRLNHFGADLEEDGIFGSLTLSAVKQFQAVFAPPVDGIVGPITWAALEKSPVDKVEKDDELVETSDLKTLAFQFLGVKNSLQNEHPIVAMVYGPMLDNVAINFLSPAPAINNQSNFVPAIPMQATTQNSPISKEEILKTQLDFILKLVAIDDGTIMPVLKGTTIEERMTQKVILLHSVVEGVKPDDLKPLSKREATLFLTRVQLMRDFYDGFLPVSAFKNGPQTHKQPLPTGPDASRRTMLVSLALSDVGKVESHNQPKRIGSKHLKHIYDTAFPDHKFTDHQFEVFKLTTQQAHGGGGTTMRDWIGSWCGIGAMYWLILAGETHHKWKEGVSGLTNTLKHRPFNQKPQVGDIVVNSKEDHHGIITWIDPDATLPPFATPFGPTGQWKNIAIKTVESNVSNGQILHAPSNHGTLRHFDRGAFLPFKN